MTFTVLSQLQALLILGLFAKHSTNLGDELIWKPGAQTSSLPRSPRAPLHGLSASSQIQWPFSRVAGRCNLKLVSYCEWHTLHKSPSTVWEISLKPDICWASPEGKGAGSNHRATLQGPAGSVVALRWSCHLQHSLSLSLHHLLQPWRTHALSDWEPENILLTPILFPSPTTSHTALTLPAVHSEQHRNLNNYPIQWFLTWSCAKDLGDLRRSSL